MWPFNKKNKKDNLTDTIAIECPKCSKIVAQVPLDDSFENRKLRCEECNIALFWINCPECETGYCTAEKNAPCPGC